MTDAERLRARIAEQFDDLNPGALNALLTRLESLETSQQLMLRESVNDFLATDQLQDYAPYPKQRACHAAGGAFDHRMLSASNQGGKSFSAGAETAMHATGEYPPWWDGLRFEHPITAWACGLTGDAVRDNPQRVLIGEVGREGTGLIPKRCLTNQKSLAKGIGGLYDFIRVKHVSGGTSLIRFRYYAQDRTAWQGPPVHWMWLDEEPPEDMYMEGMARLFGVSGKSFLSYTPILGRTQVTLRYMDPELAGKTRHWTRMTIHDAQHISKADAEKRILETPEHQRPARIYGLPSAGEGAVFPIADERILVDPFDIPENFKRLAGLDFGWSMQHPTAGVECAVDPNTDTVYVIQEYRESQRTAAEHSLVFRAWGSDLRFSWPKDGENITAGSEGIAVAQLYRNAGLKMLREHAQFVPTEASKRNRQSVVSHERGVQEMLERMQSGRLKFFRTCRKILEEKRQYHRKDGKVVKSEDDLLDALRYVCMMLRYARTSGTKQVSGNRRRPNWQAI